MLPISRVRSTPVLCRLQTGCSLRPALDLLYALLPVLHIVIVYTTPQVNRSAYGLASPLAYAACPGGSDDLDPGMS